MKNLLKKMQTCYFVTKNNNVQTEFEDCIQIDQCISTSGRFSQNRVSAMDSALKSRQITIKMVPLVPFRLRRNATAKSMKINFFSLNFQHFSGKAVVKGLNRYFEKKLFAPKWLKRHPYHTQISKQ